MPILVTRMRMQLWKSVKLLDRTLKRRKMKMKMKMKPTIVRLVLMEQLMKWC